MRARRRWGPSIWCAEGIEDDLHSGVVIQDVLLSLHQSLERLRVDMKFPAQPVHAPKPRRPSAQSVEALLDPDGATTTEAYMAIMWPAVIGDRPRRKHHP